MNAINPLKYREMYSPIAKIQTDEGSSLVDWQAGRSACVYAAAAYYALGFSQRRAFQIPRPAVTSGNNHFLSARFAC